MKRPWGVLSVVLVTTTVAGADPAAEKLFREGKALVKAGKLAEACEAFERSDNIEPKIGTLLNLADCRARQGRTATAWALFLETRARAAPSGDDRGETASKRAAALEPLLAYMTIEVSPDHAVDGLVVKRDGTPVPSTLWNIAVPLDPADYTLEAIAPRHDRWSITQPLKARDRITVTLGPLTAEPVAARPTVASRDVAAAEPPAEVVTEQVAVPVRGPDFATRYFAVGLTIGVSAGTTSTSDAQSPEELEDDNLPLGLRLVGSLPVPRGALRAIGSVLYTNGLNNKTDPTNTKKLYQIGAGVDYVWMPLPQVAFAAGLGVGWDHERRAFDGGIDTDRWTTLRASPFIYRIAKGRVELGVHTQLVFRDNGTGFLGLAAVDVFLL